MFFNVYIYLEFYVVSLSKCFFINEIIFYFVLNLNISVLNKIIFLFGINIFNWGKMCKLIICRVRL